MNLIAGKRIADEDIYLNENRALKPKEVFRFGIGLLGDAFAGRPIRICDVGCATGDFLIYMKSRFPGASLTGMDVSPSLLQAARAALPDATFVQGSVTDSGCLPASAYDVITMYGVLSILDDPEPALENLVNSVAPGGRILISSNFNEDPIDVIVRYRRAQTADAPWEIGWNIHSKVWVERILSGIAAVEHVLWHDFRMPFALPKGPDPMRAWTEPARGNPYYQVNGASLLLDRKVLEIRRRA